MPPNANELRWQNEDWDSTVRFWSLGFDPDLVEWLKDQDVSLPSITAAREFAQQYDKWLFDEPALVAKMWLNDNVHLGWKNGPPANQIAWIKRELDQMFEMMEDDRGRWLDEINGQADGLPAYMISFLRIDGERRPWTIELIRCGLAIGQIVYMIYKARFLRIRASTICPGLIPPFGPPRHPSFPSGHSFAGHFVALLLLEIPQVARIFGEDPPGLIPPIPRTVRVRAGEQATLANVMSVNVFNGPLLWLADRMAKNRERAGLHYPSDSAASRWMAGAIWALLTKNNPADATPPGAPPLGANDLIVCPTLNQVLRMAKAEWA